MEPPSTNTFLIDAMTPQAGFLLQKMCIELPHTIPPDKNPCNYVKKIESRKRKEGKTLYLKSPRTLDIGIGGNLLPED